jgi:hypothetical protein
MPEASLLTDDVRALIGGATNRGVVRVTPAAVRKAVEVFTGVPDASYSEGEEVPGYVVEALHTDSDSNDLPRLLPQSILVANEWRFARPLRMGEELTVESRVVDISERFGGKFGYSLDFRSETQFRDADGTLVAASARSMMQYDASEARAAEGEA